MSELGPRAAAAVEYYNLRSQSYFTLRDRLRRGALSLPKGRDVELLAEELLATHWEPNAEGKLKLEEKAKIAARLGRSPDRADALAMACVAIDAVAEAETFLSLAAWSREHPLW